MFSFVWQDFVVFKLSLTCDAKTWSGRCGQGNPSKIYFYYSVKAGLASRHLMEEQVP